MSLDFAFSNSAIFPERSSVSYSAFFGTEI
jgi:hypothetical protein